VTRYTPSTYSLPPKPSCDPLLRYLVVPLKSSLKMTSPAGGADSVPAEGGTDGPMVAGWGVAGSGDVGASVGTVVDAIVAGGCAVAGDGAAL
jgi:hypothetical protein